MCKIIPRIKEIVENEGITITALERTIGASKGVISRAITNGTDIQSKWLQAIVENYPRYSSEWLLTGKGSMLKDSLVAGNNLNSVEENHKLETANVLLDSHHPLTDSFSSGHNKTAHIDDQSFKSHFNQLMSQSNPHKGLPLVSVQAVGGFAGRDFSIQEQDVESYYIVPKFRNLNVDFLIEVVGDSMMPRIFPGDIIACSIIRNPQFIQWNKTYLISSEEQGMIVKRLKKSQELDSYLAVSDNPDYDPFDIPKCDIMGIARVVGVIHVE